MDARIDDSAATRASQNKRSYQQEVETRTAVERIATSALDELVVTDTIPLSHAARECSRIRQLSVASLLAETIRRIRDEESVSSLYID